MKHLMLALVFLTYIDTCTEQASSDVSINHDKWVEITDSNIIKSMVIM